MNPNPNDKGLQEKHIRAFLAEFQKEEYPVRVYAAAWIGKGENRIRWVGCRILPSKFELANLLLYWCKMFPVSPGNAITRVSPEDLPDLFRHSRQVVEAAKAAYKPAEHSLKYYLLTKQLPVGTMGHAWYQDIVATDWRKCRDVMFEMLEEAKIPNSRRVRLESARWGIDRKIILRNTRALCKKWGIKIRVLTTKAGVILERVE